MRDLSTLIQKQYELSGKILLENSFPSISAIRRVAGVDVRCLKNGSCAASAVVLSFPELKPLEKTTVKKKYDDTFPADPGFFSFRELPALLEVITLLTVQPDIILCSGQGIAHPRRLGLAAHLGVSIDKPVIGCAVSHQYGNYEEPPPGVKGAYQFLKDTDGDLLGVVLRTRPFTKPLFVSPGHKVDIETAGDIALACCKKYRIPEPLRIAHNLAKNI